MKTKTFFLSVLLLCNSVIYAQQSEKEISLFEANIERTDFLVIMDSIIGIEKDYDYYTDSLFFYLLIMTNPDDSSMCQINIYPETRKELVFGIAEPAPRAYFQHLGHTCVISNELPKPFFSLTKKKKTYRYIDRHQLYLEGKEPLIIIPEDGLFSIWTYYFYDDRFHFMEKQSP